jgi:cytochrome P450
MHTTDPAAVTPERQLEALQQMLDYADGVAREKRRKPSDDIATTLVEAEIDGERLTDSEFQWFFLLLVNAGGDTTRNLVSSGVQLLFEHPDQSARLTGDLDGLMPSAVEEMLRYVSPVVHFRRTAMADTVIRGQPIREGDKVVMWYGAANRDGEVFEDPERFDVGRTPNPHVAFGGGGAHLCLGLHVARVETACLLREVLLGLPGLTPAGEPQRLASGFIVGYHSMPVQWKPPH